jgi:peroxiredoxin
MSGVTIGARAPSFRLPSGQGPEIGPDDYRGGSNLIVWFTKGMACPFCRQHMSQLARGYSEFQTLQTEILEVTTTTPDRARVYAKSFQIPFPYLCDPDYQVRCAYGLKVRSQSLATAAKKLYAGLTTPPPPSDFGKVQPSLGEIPKLVADDDMGFFILDKDSIVRYALSGAYGTPGGPRGIPSNEELIRELQRCEQVESRATQ